MDRFVLRTAGSLVLVGLLSGCTPQTEPKSRPAGPAAKGDVAPKGDAAKPAAEANTAASGAPLAIDLEDPTEREPISVAMGLAPIDLKPGSTAMVGVKVKMAPGWHIFSVDKPSGISKPTTLKLTLPAGISPDGDWILPDSKLDATAQDPAFIYESEVLFLHRIRVAPTVAPGSVSIQCEIGYQACNAGTCRAPTVAQLPLSARVIAP